MYQYRQTSKRFPQHKATTTVVRSSHTKKNLYMNKKITLLRVTPRTRISSRARVSFEAQSFRNKREKQKINKNKNKIEKKGKDRKGKERKRTGNMPLHDREVEGGGGHARNAFGVRFYLALVANLFLFLIFCTYIPKPFLFFNSGQTTVEIARVA